MDYGDKLPTSPQYIFTPPRRYIFTPPLTVMAERKLDASDRTLRNSVVFKVVQALRHAKRRKLVEVASPIRTAWRLS